MRNFILGCITIILLIFIVYQKNENDILNSRIETLNVKVEKKAISNISNEHFKEDFYLVQLSNSTTLILSVIGFSLVFAGLFSFKLIDDKFKILKTSLESDILNNNSMIVAQNDKIDNFISSIKNENVINDEKYQELKVGLLEYKDDLTYEVSLLKQGEALEALLSKNFEGFVFYSLYSCNHLSDCYVYREGKKTEDNYLKNVFNQIINSLRDVDKNIIKINIDKKREVDYIYMIEKINRVKDPEIFKLTACIYSKINFE